MYLFDVNKEQVKSKKLVEKNNSKKYQIRVNSNKQFRKLLGLILRAYLQGRISYLVYLRELYELHIKFSKTGFSETDFVEEKRRYLKMLLDSA